MNINKQSYESKSVLDEVDAAIELLCMEHGRCTPTDVLRLLKFTECSEMRRLIIDRSISMEYVVKSSGRGYVIFDEIIPL